MPPAPARLFALVIVLALAPSARSADPPPKGTASGRVVDPDGKPVAGARVWTQVAPADAWPLEASTDTDERFRLGPLDPACRWLGTLVIDADGYPRVFLRTELRLTGIDPGRDTDLGTFHLAPGRVLTGVVLDEAGAPLAGTKVRIRFSTYSYLWVQNGRYHNSTVTDFS